jgi:ATP-dependent Clp protease ATP-binding subunit ClpX
MESKEEIKLSEHSFYKNEYEFFEDAILFREAVKEKRVNLLKSALEEIKIRIDISKQKNIEIPFFSRTGWTLSLAEIFLLIVSIAVHICTEMFDEANKKSTLILIILKANITSLREVNSILNHRKSSLFDNAVLIDKNTSIEISDDILNSILVPKYNVKKRVKEYSPSDLCQSLSKYVLGHENAKQQFCIGVFEHLVRCHALKHRSRNIKKNNILILGPTGTGKTYMCESMAKILDIPLLTFDATQYSETSYIGMSVSDIVADAYQSVGGDNGKLKPCIIFIDEIDKLAARPGRYGETKGVIVQRELLKIIEGDECILNDSMLRERARYNVSNVLFVAAGAFSGLEKFRGDRGGNIGFISNRKTESTSHITPQDLIDYGMIPEFVGRFSYLIELDSLSKEDLKDILLNSEESIFNNYKNLFETCGYSFSLCEEKIEELVENAYKSGTGARGLNSAVNNLIKDKIYNMSFNPYKNGKCLKKD